jgi:hypothetical protein
MTTDDLSWVSDDELYRLEQQRGLDPRSWAEIDAELRRRRASRGAGPADLARSATEPSTVRDLERVADSLEATLEGRLDTMEKRIRRLRWWTVAAPLIWIGMATATWVALQLWAPEVLSGLVVLR